MAASAPSGAESARAGARGCGRGRLRLALALAVVHLSCGPADATSVLLQVMLGPGASVPDELRIDARQDGHPLFEDQRLPRAGRLLAERPPLLGTIVIELDPPGGEIAIAVRGLSEGKLVSRGAVEATAAAGRQTPVLVELAMDPEPPPLPPPERACLQSCGRCLMCDPGTGGCRPLAAGERDLRSDRACQDTLACDGRGGCRTALGGSCGDPADCASGFCVDGVCCEGACPGPCRRCGGGRCLPIVDAIDPRSCRDGRQCDSRGECLKASGRACASGQECASGFCVDGLCCSSSCDAPCRHCAQGVCTVSVDRDDRECTGGRRCDDRGLCR